MLAYLVHGGDGVEVGCSAEAEVHGAQAGVQQAGGRGGGLAGGGGGDLWLAQLQGKNRGIRLGRCMQDL